MNLKELFAEEDAVSPVIGVILMVAITVILAAVIGTFVLGLGENVQDSAPQANFQFEYQTVEVVNDNTKAVTVTHTGGEDVEASNVRVQIGGDYAYPVEEVSGTNQTADDFTGTISTGTSATYDVTSSAEQSSGTSVENGAAPPGLDTSTFSYISGNQDVRVIWTSPSGGTSNTIGQSTVPN